MHRTLQLVSFLTSLLVVAWCGAAEFSPAQARGAEPTSARVLLADLTIPKDGALVVTSSGKLQPGEFLRPALGANGRGGVIVIEKQNDITLDMRAVVLRGATIDTPLDRLAGYALVVRDCSNVTIQGGTISGFGACVVVERSKNVVLDGMKFDRWYGMRLSSTIAAENEADWLWPHENDDNQWLVRYGAAISFTDCAGVTVRNSRGRHGQNGILMLRCEASQMYDNDFSFLSGWGLAMYRTSECIVSRNIFDYCVRGYSHGVYWRGQDSAAILMFERCSDNVIAYNSATHSGDGIFLFAGRDSVEGLALARGEKEVGGSDRNLFYANDFSFAVANGIEATFSSENRAVANQIRGCHQHGVWGGYSSRMALYQNTIESTLGGAITIEHGQDCLIAENVLHDNQIGVELYWDEDPDLVGGPFGKRFDTSSKGHLVYKNSFAGNDSDFVVSKTTALSVGENVYKAHGRELSGSAVRGVNAGALDTEALRALFAGIGGWSASGRLADVSVQAAAIDDLSVPAALALERKFAAPKAPGVQRAFDPDKDDGQGLETIVMGEWGPWDFRSGEARPVQRTPGGVLADAKWEAVWFSWKDGPDPRGGVEALKSWRALVAQPLASATVTSWYSPHAADPAIQARVGSNHFGVIARTTAKLAAGRYRLSVVSDDGVRVSIDKSPVLENWTWHGPTRDLVELELNGAAHEFELEYFQIDGASALSLDLERLP